MPYRGRVKDFVRVSQELPRLDLHLIDEPAAKHRPGDQSAERGFVRFVPLDAGETAAQAVHMVAIVDGRYAVQTGGGLVPGDYRVEAAAERLTGRLVPALHEGAPLPERQPESDPAFAGPKSPLEFTAVAGRSATFDIDLPAAAPAK